MSTTTPNDELDALTRVAEMRAILARAGRHDLADLAWAELCPADVPLRVRHDALKMAGYPFGKRPGEHSPSILPDRETTHGGKVTDARRNQP